MTKYPGITKAALLIAYDNGGIHRDRTEERMLKELEFWLTNVNPLEPYLPAIDAWLADLSSEARDIICTGEEFEAQAILATAPPMTDEFLNLYFNEVC